MESSLEDARKVLGSEEHKAILAELNSKIKAAR
jgi:hypothetical protein